VAPDGRRVERLPEGVVVRPAVVQLDARGALTEIYSPAWGLGPEWAGFTYHVRLRPGWVRGWVVHEQQWDRLYFFDGLARIVLYDSRPGSPTECLVATVHTGREAPALVLIPPGVFHAVQALGDHDVQFVNSPSAPYRHEAPDKRRLPLDTDLIPYDFGDASGR
jgi:dTDP-4-dehydrorhamnose 3,5-epimerase